MRIYAVLGSAPLGADRLSFIETNEHRVLISFFDYGKSFKDLATIHPQLKAKYHDRQNKHQPRSAG